MLTVMKRGIIRAGGGTGFSVVRNRLEPSAEYEYVFDVRKSTCELTVADANRNPALASTEAPNSNSLCVETLLEIDIFTSITDSVNW